MVFSGLPASIVVQAITSCPETPIREVIHCASWLHHACGICHSGWWAIGVALRVLAPQCGALLGSPEEFF